MNVWRCLTIISVFLCLLLPSHPGLGSGGSIISSGPLAGRGGDTGYRQLLELKGKGDFFWVAPVDSPIRLITINAPGVNGGTLILRELAIEDQKTSLLVSAPDHIRPYILRATLYFSHEGGEVTCYQGIDDGWNRLEAIRMISMGSGQDGVDPDALWACPTDRLGLFVFSYQTPEALIDVTSMVRKDGLVPMGSVQKGIFPWICAGMVFLTIGILSYLIHKMEC